MAGVAGGQDGGRVRAHTAAAILKALARRVRAGRCSDNMEASVHTDFGRVRVLADQHECECERHCAERRLAADGRREV